MNPTDTQLDAISELPQDRPIVMLNLVKLREHSADGDGTGWDAYLRYSRGFAPLLKACGGTILWAGDAKGVAIGDDEGDAWDYVVLVQYPRPADFVDTMTSAAYEAINHHRHNALAKHLIVPVSQTYTKLVRGS
jgi:uncharacterized protein (DUF1330 family)